MSLFATGQRSRLFAGFVAFSLVVGFAVVAAQPASAVIDTPNSCPDEIDSAGFTDLVGFDRTTRHAIDCLAEYGITRGTSATTFSPWLEVTRWQMALFLIRQADIHGIDIPSGSSVGFTDIGGLNAETQRAINQLDRLGITEGTTATSFSPNELVTRWQMALFLTRTLEADGIEPPEGVITRRGTTPKVGAPDLVRVSFDDDDADETRLLFEFDEPVSSNIDEDEIWLVTWDGDLINPNRVDKSDDDPEVVEAIFFNEDYDNAVAGAVTSGAVYDIDNLYNTMGSDGIQSVTIESIDWPDDYPELVEVGSFDAGDDTVEFEFDQEVDYIGDDTDFVLIEQDGTVHEGTGVVDTDDVEVGDDTVTVLTVEFDGILESEWNDVVRAYADEGAVEGRDNALENLPIAVDVADSGRSDTPYLTGIDLTGADDGIVVFEFNADVDDINDVATSDFVLVFHDGSTESTGTADRNDGDRNEVEVDFGARLPSDIVVYATVLNEAVSRLGDDSNVDTYRMKYQFDEHDTAGPDLVSSEGSTSGLGDDTFTIVFEFDEDLDDTVAEFTFDPDDHLLAWDEEGELVTLSGGEVTIDGDTMEIEFVDPDPGVEELNDGDVVWFGIFAQFVADEFGFTSYPDGIGCDCSK